jgi:hypothetical protein
MSPAEQIIQISESDIEFIIPLGADENHVVGQARNLPDRFCQGFDPVVGGDPFTVHHALI